MVESEALTKRELARYSRHLNLPEVGSAGQLKLKSASALVVGAGGLGCPIISYLAAAGLGKIGIVDFDLVDISNLQRQVLYDTNDIGRSKAATASQKAQAANPEIDVIAHNEELTAANIERIFAGYELIIDATDNFATRYLINDACVLQNKPCVYGAIHRFEGQATVFFPGLTPCYRCIFPQAPEHGTVANCSEAGVLGVLPGIIGSIQAAECIKIILSIGESLTGRLILFDALAMSFRTIKIKRRLDCEICGDAPSIKSLVKAPSNALCQLVVSMSAGELAHALAQPHRLFLIDVRESYEYEFSHLNNATHIPLSELAARSDELDLSDDIVVYCRSGARSRRAAEILQAHGACKVRNLLGGIEAWAHQVEPSLQYL